MPACPKLCSPRPRARVQSGCHLFPCVLCRGRSLTIEDSGRLRAACCLSNAAQIKKKGVGVFPGRPCMCLCVADSACAPPSAFSIFCGSIPPPGPLICGVVQSCRATHSCCLSSAASAFWLALIDGARCLFLLHSGCFSSGLVLVVPFCPCVSASGRLPAACRAPSVYCAFCVGLALLNACVFAPCLE